MPTKTPLCPVKSHLSITYLESMVEIKASRITLVSYALTKFLQFYIDNEPIADYFI